jgi:hypothetical protein
MTQKSTSRTLLQFAIAIGGCVPVTAGIYSIFLGKDMFGKITASVSLDSHLCYLSGLLLGIGVAFWNFIPKIEKRSKEMLLLTLIVVIGGLARLYDALFIEWPPLTMQLALVMELVVTPALCVWQRHVAKQYAANPDKAV